jgi:hypothetical protein
MCTFVPRYPPSPMPTSFYAFHHSHLKQEKRAFKFLTEQYGQTIKHSNPRWGMADFERCSGIETKKNKSAKKCLPSGARALWMPPLLPTPMDSTWGDYYELPELPTQCNIQCPTPIPVTAYSRQAITNRAPHTNARNQTGHYLPKNEPAPISEAGHGTSNE